MTVSRYAAAAAYLETVIDAHSNGQRKLTSATLQTLGRRLFRAGCRSFATGDLHHGIERFEGASRFLELAEENSDQLNVQAWLAYCYMIQDRPDKAKSRAVAALRVAERVQPNAGDVASLMSDAAGLEEGDEGVDDDSQGGADGEGDEEGQGVEGDRGDGDGVEDRDAVLRRRLGHVDD